MKFKSIELDNYSDSEAILTINGDPKELKKLVHELTKKVEDEKSETTNQEKPKKYTLSERIDFADRLGIDYFNNSDFVGLKGRYNVKDAYGCKGDVLTIQEDTGSNYVTVFNDETEEEFCVALHLIDKYTTEKEFNENLLSKMKTQYLVGSTVFIKDIDEIFPSATDKNKVFEIKDYGLYSVDIMATNEQRGYIVTLQEFDNLTVSKVN